MPPHTPLRSSHFTQSSLNALFQFSNFPHLLIFKNSSDYLLVDCLNFLQISKAGEYFITPEYLNYEDNVTDVRHCILYSIHIYTYVHWKIKKFIQILFI